MTEGFDDSQTLRQIIARLHTKWCPGAPECPGDCNLDKAISETALEVIAGLLAHAKVAAQKEVSTRAQADAATLRRIADVLERQRLEAQIRQTNWTTLGLPEPRAVVAILAAQEAPS